MGIFKRGPKPPESGVEPFDSWEIAAPMSDGSEMRLGGHVAPHLDPAEALRYVEAIADGLRRAGLHPEVSIERRVRTRR